MLGFMTSVIQHALPVAPATPAFPTVDMFGTPVHVCEQQELWQAVRQAVTTRERLFALSVNVHWLQLAAHQPDVAELTQGFDLRLVDGKPIQVLARSMVGHGVAKLSGADLVPALCERSAAEGWRLFFLGAAPGVADRAAERARALFPGCQVVGTAAPDASVVDDPVASAELCRTIDANTERAFGGTWGV